MTNTKTINGCYNKKNQEKKLIFLISVKRVYKMNADFNGLIKKKKKQNPIKRVEQNKLNKTQFYPSSLEKSNETKKYTHRPCCINRGASAAKQSPEMRGKDFFYAL